MNGRSFLLFMVAMFSAVLLLAQPPRKLTAAQLQQDFELFTRALQEAHPGLYRYSPKEEIERLFENTKNAITDMDEESFYRMLMPVIASIKCGHTKFHPEGKADDPYPYRQQQLFPLKLYFTGGKAYMLASYIPGTVIPRGAEIVSINKIRIPALLDKLRGFVTADGNVRSAFDETMNRSFNGYLATFIMHTPEYQVSYHHNRKTKSTTVPGVSLATIHHEEAAVKAEKKPVQLPLRLELKQNNPKQNGTAILTIESFYVDKAQQDFHRFIDSAFLVLKTKEVKNLVIDLRNNEGGVEEWGGYLYGYLADKAYSYYKKIRVARKDTFSFRQYAWLPPQYDAARQLIQEKDGEFLWPMQEYLSVHSPHANAFMGNLYVLVNGNSFSVTSEFAAVVKHNKRAVFIGSETGGAYEGNNSGVFAIVTLPNSRLTVGIPLMAFYMDVLQDADGRGIMPDHLEENSLEDTLKNVDGVMEYTLRLIEVNKIN